MNGPLHALQIFDVFPQLGVGLVTALVAKLGLVSAQYLADRIT